MINKVCVLLSGGIDSTGLIHYYKRLRYSVYPLLINYGQKAFHSEKKSSLFIVNHFGTNNLRIIDLKNISLQSDNPLIIGYRRKLVSYRKKSNAEYFPNRNLFLLTVASIYAKENSIDKISIGIIDSGPNSYPDTTNQFLRKVNQLFKKVENISIEAPFVNKNKIFIINSLKKSDFEISFTYSCNIRSNKPCLNCASCIERTFSLRKSLYG